MMATYNYMDDVATHISASPYAIQKPDYEYLARSGEDIMIYGDGRQTRDFVYVSDVVRANVAAIEHGDGDVFNVVTGSSVTIRELAESIVDCVGAEGGIVHEDERVGGVRDSRADVEKVSAWWRDEVELLEGLGTL